MTGTPLTITELTARNEQLAKQVARLERALLELTQHVAGRPSPINFTIRPDLASLCRERWPDMKGLPAPGESEAA